MSAPTSAPRGRALRRLGGLCFMQHSEERAGGRVGPNSTFIESHSSRQSASGGEWVLCLILLPLADLVPLCGMGAGGVSHPGDSHHRVDGRSPRHVMRDRRPRAAPRELKAIPLLLMMMMVVMVVMVMAWQVLDLKARKEAFVLGFDVRRFPPRVVYELLCLTRVVLKYAPCRPTGVLWHANGMRECERRAALLPHARSTPTPCESHRTQQMIPPSVPFHFSSL